MPDRNGLDELDRLKRISKIDEKITALRSELPVVPTGLAEFVSHWRDVQEQCNAACTAQAQALDAGLDGEKNAWKKLNLSELINDRGLNPCD
jgi:hypothetical protein